MRSKVKLAVLHIPETEFEVLLRRSSDYLKKARKLQPLTKPVVATRKTTSAA
jgi:hypothetical protein